MIDVRAPMRDGEVEQQRCTHCGATAGNPCVYMPPMTYGHEQPRTPSNEHQWARVGQPTRRPHGVRYNATRTARRRENAAEQLRRAKIVPPAVARLIEIHKAETQFDAIERHKLHLWLACHSSLLTVQSPPAVDER